MLSPKVFKFSISYILSLQKLITPFVPLFFLLTSTTVAFLGFVFSYSRWFGLDLGCSMKFGCFCFDPFWKLFCLVILSSCRLCKFSSDNPQFLLSFQITKKWGFVPYSVPEGFLMRRNSNHSVIVEQTL